jgi:hypothetical protein
MDKGTIDKGTIDKGTIDKTFICCRCINIEEKSINMIHCRACNVSLICKDCFYMMLLNNMNEIVCPVCCHVYYEELKNTILKYGLFYSIGIEKMSSSLFYLWKRNSKL